MKTRYYMVAGHRFGVTAADAFFALMGNYEYFATEDSSTEPVFALTIEQGKAVDYTEQIRQEEEGQTIICGKTADGKSVFEFIWWGATAGWLVSAADYREDRLIITGQHTKMAIDNALMVLFALATADKGTVLFHAAVVSHKGRGYMFLGPSGTGKSTHAGLWVKYIEGTALVNDDNPVVRLDSAGQAVVYGSPWSGKTPCYRNVSYPLGGLVELSQAPYNKIRRLGAINAYIAMMVSISGSRWEDFIAKGLYDTESALLTSVAVWHLECLPDRGAVELCQSTITI